MKTVLFVPGFDENITTRDYTATINAIKSKGYNVEFIDIKWARTTIDQWVAELNKVYKNYDPRQTILAGFSFGAMTAFVVASKRNPSEVWLFSLSPYFAEDIKNKGMKKSWLSQIGHRRVDAFSKLNFVELSKMIKTKTIYFYGDLELKRWPDISYRNQALKSFGNNQTKVIQGVGHDVANSNYVTAIIENI